jgi:AcrR family transcriptional regulator
MNESTNGTEPGLRARKKQQTEAMIVENAIRLFRDQGVRSASLSEIARASRVSPATLFNYFPNKGCLAEAWIRGELDEALVSVARDLGDHGLRSAMRSLCRRLASLVSRQHAVRLGAWRETGRATAEPLSPQHPIVVALSGEQERERVRGDISAQALGELLVDAIEGGMIAGLRANGTDAELSRALQARVDLILDGARKKNERVAAPSASGGTPRQAGTRPPARSR